jgi:mono/diheme cytochrome c family protein
MRRRNILFAVLTVGIIPFFAMKERQTFDLKASISRGKDVYAANCMSCHMENGEGLEGAFPPLAKSDYLMADKKRSIQQTLHGVSGEIKVNGTIYNGEMPGVELSDTELSDVLNFVRNSWGNKGEAVKPEEVKSLR